MKTRENKNRNILTIRKARKHDTNNKAPAPTRPTLLSNHTYFTTHTTPPQGPAKMTIPLYRTILLFHPYPAPPLPLILPSFSFLSANDPKITYYSCMPPSAPPKKLQDVVVAPTQTSSSFRIISLLLLLLPPAPFLFALWQTSRRLLQERNRV